MSSEDGKVLIVDDKASYRRIVRDLLINRQIPSELIDEAENYEDAEEKINNIAYFVMILDVVLDPRLPQDLSGVVLAQLARNSELNRESYIINISAAHENKYANNRIKVKEGGHFSSLADHVVQERNRIINERANK